MLCWLIFLSHYQKKNRVGDCLGAFTMDALTFVTRDPCQFGWMTAPKSILSFLSKLVFL
jgi:hypothetical protein